MSYDSLVHIGPLRGEPSSLKRGDGVQLAFTNRSQLFLLVPAAETFDHSTMLPFEKALVPAASYSAPAEKGNPVKSGTAPQR